MVFWPPWNGDGAITQVPVAYQMCCRLLKVQITIQGCIKKVFRSLSLGEIDSDVSRSNCDRCGTWAELSGQGSSPAVQTHWFTRLKLPCIDPGRVQKQIRDKTALKSRFIKATLELLNTKQLNDQSVHARNDHTDRVISIVEDLKTHFEYQTFLDTFSWLSWLVCLNMRIQVHSSLYWGFECCRWGYWFCFWIKHWLFWIASYIFWDHERSADTDRVAVFAQGYCVIVSLFHLRVY